MIEYFNLVCHIVLLLLAKLGFHTVLYIVVKSGRKVTAHLDYELATGL